MNAKPHSNQIGVHSLSEFVFCPRAGIISHLQRSEDGGTDGWLPDLSYMPEYDIAAIDGKLKFLRAKQSKLLIFSAGVVLYLLAMYLFVKPFVAFLFLVVSMPVAIYFGNIFLNRLLQIRRLEKTLADYRASKKARPDLSKAGVSEFSWHSLMKIGDLERCHDILVDEDLGISGKPWKLLRTGELCFPVFRCKQPKPHNADLSDARSWLYRQHYVRIAAYCELIERCTGDKAFAGIIVFSGTYRAIVVNVFADAKIKEELALAIDSAQQTLAIYESQQVTETPDKQICRGCPHGNPRIFNYATTTLLNDGTPVPTNLHRVKNKSRHSKCGDFFKWVPPHEKAYEHQLRRN